MINIKLRPSHFILGYHLFLLVTLPIYFYFYTPSLALILISFALYFCTGLGITAGYHRLFSHRAYQAHPLVEFVLIFLGTLALQSSVLKWASDHRRHHAFTDTDQDPYSIKKGFWYAHCLWLFDKDHPIDPKLVSDLIKNKMVAFQHAHYGLLAIGTNFLVWLVVGLLMNDFMGAFFMAVMLRMLVLHHATWCINSVAHIWGDRPFSNEQTAAGGYLVALLTFGEGYHNYHHVFPNDYRNGIRWYHFDPSKWIIWTLHKVGLATRLKAADDQSIEKRLLTAKVKNREVAT